MFKDIRIALIFSVVLLDIIGIGVIFPIIPDLLKEVGIDKTASAAFWGGLLSSSYAFMQFVFSPTIGTLSDIFGRRPVLLMASILLGIDYLLMGFAENILILFIGRIIGGLAGGTIATGTAYLADISDNKDKNADRKNGALTLISPINPPIIGPNIKPSPKAAPMMAKFFFLFLVSEISAK